MKGEVNNQSPRTRWKRSDNVAMQVQMSTIIDGRTNLVFKL